MSTMHASHTPPLPAAAPARSLRKTSSISSYGDEDDPLGMHECSFPDDPPKHWCNTFASDSSGRIGRFLGALFAGLCLVSVGHDSMEQKWRDLSRSEESYREHMGRLTTRLGTITVMIGLLLASTATLITTQAPRSQILDYSMRGACICFWASFLILLGAGIVGSAGIFVMTTCTRHWTLNLLVASRMRLVFILIILAYPFVAVGISTLFCIFGILVAAWNSADPIVRNGSAFLFVSPLLMALLFAACAVPLERKHVREDAGSA